MALLKAFIVPHPPIIIPEIGRGEERKISNTIQAFHTIAKEINALKPETIIIISPHAKAYSDCFSLPLCDRAEGTFRDFGASQVKLNVSYNQPLIKSIVHNSNKMGIDIYSQVIQKDSLDHGTMVPLYFIHQYNQDFSVVRIPLSGLSSEIHYKLGQSIRKAIDDTNQKVVIIASGDLSHKLKKDGPYGLSKEGPLFDQEITEAMAKGDFLKLMTMDEDFCYQAAECGRRSFIIMAGILDGYSVASKLLSYEGPFGVGYAVAEFEPLNKDESRHFLNVYETQLIETAQLRKNNEDSYVQLARNSLENYVLTNKTIKVPEGLPSEMLKQKAGVFVSLKIAGALRGCIGTTGPTTENIATEIIQNAISAGLKDPRFSPVEMNELGKITYSVDVLGKAEAIQSKAELDPIRYGVIVRYLYKSGLLLPNLEGVDTVEEQLSIALRKAGIKESEPYSIQRFEVIRHY